MPLLAILGADLQRRLCHQLISGVRSSETRKKLLQKDRDFENALQVAFAEEAACREVSELDTQQTTQVHQVKRHQRSNSVM